MGFVIATKKDFSIFDVDDTHTPVNHTFGIINDADEMNSVRPSADDSIYSIRFDEKTYYTIDRFSGTLKVAAPLDADGRSNGLQHLMLTVSDGVNQVKAIINFEIIPVNEPPVSVDPMQYFCIDEMVGWDYELCAAKKDASKYAQFDWKGTTLTERHNAQFVWDDAAGVPSSLDCPRLYEAVAGSCPTTPLQVKQIHFPSVIQKAITSSTVHHLPTSLSFQILRV